MKYFTKTYYKEEVELKNLCYCSNYSLKANFITFNRNLAPYDVAKFQKDTQQEDNTKKLEANQIKNNLAYSCCLLLICSI